MTRPVTPRDIAVAHQAVQSLEHAADQEWLRLVPYNESYRDNPRPPPKWVLERVDAMPWCNVTDRHVQRILLGRGRPSYWLLVLAAERARDRFHKLLEIRALQLGDRDDVRRDLLEPLLSWGVPGSDGERCRLPTSSAYPKSVDGEEPELHHNKGKIETYRHTGEPASAEGHREPGAPTAESGGALSLSPEVTCASNVTPAGHIPAGPPEPSRESEARTPERYTGTPQSHDETAAGHATVVEAAGSDGTVHGAQDAPPTAAPFSLEHGAGDCAVCAHLATHVRPELLEVA